ncbi:MAG: DUF2207 domain-containing protein [Candidatus Andersenbacteria bacterium]
MLVGAAPLMRPSSQSSTIVWWGSAPLRLGMVDACYHPVVRTPPRHSARKLILGSAAALLAVAALAAAVRPTPALAKSYDIDRWSARYEVQKNGDVRVHETQTLRFSGSFSFYDRVVPINRFDALKDVEVVDDTSGAPLEFGKDFEVSPTESGGFEAADILLHFRALDETRTWTISYTAVGAIGFFEDHDEFYWNVIPSDRDVPINHVDATLVLPDDVGADKIRTTFYQNGVADGQQQVVDGTTATFTAGVADPGTDFTIVVGWPTGLVKNPGIVRVESSPLSGATVLIDGEDTGLTTPVGLRLGHELTPNVQHAIQVSKYGITSQATYATVEAGKITVLKLAIVDTPAKWIVVIVLGGLLALYLLLPLWIALILWLRWRTTGRDPRGQGTIVAQFEPPPPGNKDNPDQPGVVGTLIDERADLKDLTASIIDLAVRGYLVLEELGKKRFGAQDYKLIKKKSWEGDPDLQPYERDLLAAVFGGSDERTLNDLKNKFYVQAPGIQSKLYDEVVERGYFVVSPEKRRSGYYGAGTIMIVLGFIVTTSLFGAGIPLLVAGIVVVLFGRAAPQRTRTASSPRSTRSASRSTSSVPSATWCAR